MIIIACFIALIILLEAILRFCGLSHRQSRLTIYEFDQELGWRNRASARQLRMIPDERGVAFHNIYSNPDGFATDEDHWHDSARKDVRSLMIVGDSFAAGEYLPYAKTFPYLIGAMMPELQVINTGVPGYAPDQYLMVARKYLPRYLVDITVIIFFPFNDICDLKRDTLSGYQRPNFGTSLEKPLNTPLQQTRGKPRTRNFIQKIADNSSIYTLIRPIIKNSNHVYNPKFWVVSEREITYSRDGMKQAALFMNQIQKENPKTKVFIYYMPHWEELLQPKVLAKNIHLFQNAIDEFGLASILPRALRHLSDPRKAYNIGDGHLSELGAKLVAEEIVQQVYTSMRLRASSMP